MENIQVALRLRPLSEKEKDAGDFVPWRVKFNSIEVTKQEVDPILGKKPVKQNFTFDHCFSEAISNEQVYLKVAKSVIMSSLEGYNGTLFMYGQTGSGKTYTMLGYQQHGGLYNQGAVENGKSPNPQMPPAGVPGLNTAKSGGEDLGIEDFDEKYPDYVYDSSKADFESNTGILVQSLRDIFKAIEQDQERTFFLKCSYFEIYNDLIYDLLKPRGNIGEPLPLIEDVKNDNFVIKGITVESVASIRNIFEKLKKGELNRHYAETFMNHSSSRSHCIFRLSIKMMTNSFIKEYRAKNAACSNVNIHMEMDNTLNNEGTIVTESYLNFIDLAGSERMSAHIKNPEKMTEDDFEDPPEKPKDINSRIKEGKSINKSLFFLTQVISLKAEGGNFRTAVVLCINPANSQIDHSLSTMRFGTNAKKIQNKIKANVVTNSDDQAIRLLIESYEKRLRDLTNQHDEGEDKYRQYIGIIDELKMQRSSLLERLENANKKLAIKFYEEVPEAELKRFFYAVKTNAAFFDSAGMLFTGKAQSKYDEIDKRDLFEGPTKVEEMKGKFSRLMTTPSDLVGKLGFKMYLKTKQEFEALKSQADEQKEYVLTVCNNYKTMCAFMRTVTNLGEAYLSKLKKITEQYQSEYLLSHERRIKLELYEHFKGFSLLSDKDLGTMKDYINDLAEAVKSELDRRELLTSKTDLPIDVIEGLEKLANNELEEQEENLDLLKNKIKDFVAFQQGCESEIEYYRSLNQDFDKQHQTELKLQEIDKMVNVDMARMNEKIEQMTKNFHICDDTLETTQKEQLDKKLKEYKTKFEKLVDVVLGEKKKGVPETSFQDLHLTSTGNLETMSVSGQQKLKRSNSIDGGGMNNIFDAIGKLAQTMPGKAEMDSKVKKWLNLKELESRPMNYEHVLSVRDDQSVYNFRSPGLKRDTADGSLLDIRSQNADLQVSALNSPMQKPSKRDAKKLTEAFGLRAAADGELSARKERDSYRIEAFSNQNNKPFDTEGMIYKTVGTPSIRSRQTLGARKTGGSRREETLSFRPVIAEDAVRQLKRSYSNQRDPDADEMPGSLFGSATEFDLKLIQGESDLQLSKMVSDSGEQKIFETSTTAAPNGNLYTKTSEKNEPKPDRPTVRDLKLAAQTNLARPSKPSTGNREETTASRLIKKYSNTSSNYNPTPSKSVNKRSIIEEPTAAVKQVSTTPTTAPEDLQARKMSAAVASSNVTGKSNVTRNRGGVSADKDRLFLASSSSLFTKPITTAPSTATVNKPKTQTATATSTARIEISNEFKHDSIGLFKQSSGMSVSEQQRQSSVQRNKR